MPVTMVDRTGTPCMCKYCDLLRHVLTQSSRNACSSCASPYTGTEHPIIYSGCVVYALIHQNTFSQRWNEIQLIVTAIPSVQTHPSINSSHSIEETIPPRRQGILRFSSLATTTDSPQPLTRMTVNLITPPYTLEEIRQILTATPTSHQYTNVHNLIQLCRLRWNIYTRYMDSYNREKLWTNPPDNILSPVNYGIITTYSTRYVVAFNDTQYHLCTIIPMCDHYVYTTSPTMSYLRHTHDVDEQTWHRLEITTTLLSTRPQFKWSNRRLMMRTTTHSPDLVTTLTFPADSLQHQLSILTLVTHLILSVLCLKQT